MWCVQLGWHKQVYHEVRLGCFQQHTFHLQWPYAPHIAQARGFLAGRAWLDSAAATLPALVHLPPWTVLQQSQWRVQQLQVMCAPI